MECPLRGLEELLRLKVWPSWPLWVVTKVFDGAFDGLQLLPYGLALTTNNCLRSAL